MEWIGVISFRVYSVYDFLSFSLPFSCTEFGKKIFFIEDYNTKIYFDTAPIIVYEQ